MKHNYFDSTKAEKELGYRPVQTTAGVLRNMVTYYRSLGYQGEVVSPGLLPWLVAPPGVALTGVLGYNAGGSFTACIDALQNHGLVSADALRTAVEAILSAGIGIGASVAGGDPAGVLADVIVVIFWAATVCHLIQGFVVFALAWPRFMAAGPWGVQSFFLGFPSTREFIIASNMGSGKWVREVCVTAFMLCVPLVLLLRAAWDAATGGK